ncbi:MAG: HIT domain-containing protein [Chloroflexi bacterium]|nr:HIT domain-containing protein [Chloroflexota bacterium]
MTERLWTPWRMEFIVSKKDGECIFCAKPREARDRENYILARGVHAYIILNAYPYNNGHLMAVPYAHVPTLEQLDPATAAELMALTQRSLVALRRALSPDGFNVGMNIGRAAGAGIADHVHLHVVPRWSGDTNFMPVIADTRLLPELLAATRERLMQAGIAEPPA